MIRALLVAALVSAVLPLGMTGAGQVRAGTLQAPAFEGSVTVNGVTSGPAAGTVGTSGGCDLFGDASGCDLNTGASAPRLLIDWLDDTQFDVFMFGEIGFGNSAPVSFTLTGLIYLGSGNPAPISGFFFDRANSNVDGFLASPINPTGASFDEPVLSFTDTSVTADFADFSGQLEADGPRLRYRIETKEPPVSPVPLPAAGWLLAAGLAAIAGLRQKRRPI